MIYIFSRLVNVLGVVRPILNKNLHLAATLANGQAIIGQHRITAKDTRPLKVPIQKLMLSSKADHCQPTTPLIRPRICSLIQSADLICYPMGSFYSSLLANLLPQGVGRAIAPRDCPKVYIPSTGEDPETIGLNLMTQVHQLLNYLRADAPNANPQQLLHFIIVDQLNDNYTGELDERQLKQWGIRIIDTDLVAPRTSDRISSQKLVSILLSLA